MPRFQIRNGPIMKNRGSGPGPGAIGTSVAITTGCAVIVFAIGAGFAKDAYRTAQNLGSVKTGFWIFTSYKEAQVSLGQLGVGTILSLLALAVIYGLIIHPVVGRLVQMAAQSLTDQVVQLYRLDLRQWEWDPETSIVFGSAWPITVLSIPLLLIALVGGLIYRALWRWPST